MKSLFVTAAALVTLLPFAALADDAERVISVRGEGVVRLVPDMATLTIGVRHEAPAAREAMTAMNDALTPVIERLRSAGIADGDIQTGALGLDPVYTYSDNAPPTVTAYAAYSSVNVVVRDIAKVGEVLDAVVSDGANTLSGLNFGVTDQSQALEEARRAAVADAHARATLYAEAAGVTLGEVLRISEDDNRGSIMPMADIRMAAPAPVAIAAGEIEMARSVSVTYAIAD